MKATGVTVRNSVVAGYINCMLMLRDTISGTVGASSSYNLIDGGTGSIGPVNELTTTMSALAPARSTRSLAYFTNIGGPTETHALLTSSPAINTANNATCPATDQRGTARP